MTNRHFLTLSLVLLATASGMARTIDATEARGIAESFFFTSGIEAKALPQVLSPASTSATDAEPYYVFNAGNERGFVIIAGDDRLGRVLGYADSGSFSLDGAPQGLIALMDLYAAYMKNSTITADNNISQAGTPAMDPLLGSTAWGQDYPFNTLCPSYTSSGKQINYYTGCVVTAATQIMKYYNYPATGTGSKSYLFGGTTLSADFGATTYNWDEMPGEVPDSPTAAQTLAYSTLAYHFGVAVEMQYAQDGSGAYSTMVPEALKTYFGYDSGLQMHPREYYNSQEWLSMIKNELNAGRPVYYGATSDTGMGGHAFVCDGYDSNDYVHINWGWYGRSNGYFLINHLDPSSLGEGGGAGGYNRSQEIITGIKPADPESAPAYTLYGATRLSAVDYTSVFTIMSFIENLDVNAVKGKVGALLMKDGEIIAVLGSETVTIPGFAGGHNGSVSIYMRNVPTTAKGVEDGGGYIVKLGVLPEGESEWIVMRHPVGLASYINASVVNERVVLGESHQPAPDVELLSPITTDGNLYASGSGLFRLSLANNSSDYRLSKITVRLTSTADPSTSVDLTGDVNVYDLSSENVELLLELPSDMEPGEYDVTAFDPSFPANLFDDSDVGRTRLTVLPAATVPVVRTTSAPVWQAADGSQSIGQGEGLYIVAKLRNYGAAGTASVIARLTDTENPKRSYVFVQQNKSVGKSEAFSLTFYRKAMLDPGTYSLSLTALDADGEETELDSPVPETLITIAESQTPDLDVVSFNLPETIYLSERKPYELTLRARKDFSGTVYVRIRQFTNTSGEIVFMKSGVSLNAGAETTLSFNYRPDVAEGLYMVIVESRPVGLSTGNEIPAGNIDAYYRELTVANPSAIGSIGPDASGIEWTVEDNTLSVVSSSAVRSVSIFDMGGKCVRRVSGVGKVDISTLPAGVGVAVVETAGGVESFKFIKH